MTKQEEHVVRARQCRSRRHTDTIGIIERPYLHNGLQMLVQCKPVGTFAKTETENKRIMKLWPLCVQIAANIAKAFAEAANLIPSRGPIASDVACLLS